MESYEKFAKLYDGFMDDVNYGAWAEYVIKLIALHGGEVKRVLECGCGTGNITLPLKRAGFDVTACDSSRDMLEIASEKARSAGLRIPFVMMDMRKLSVHRPVDAVIACCDCVNYLTDKKSVLDFFSSAYSALKSGGKLLFDISSEYKLERILGGNCFSDSREDRAYFWKNNYDEKSKLIEMELEFFVRSKETEPLYERFFERHVQRAHSEKELALLLDESGFKLEGVYGAFGFDAPKPDDERLQFVAIKQN